MSSARTLFQEGRELRVRAAGGLIFACELSPGLSLTERNSVQLAATSRHVDGLRTGEQVVENADDAGDRR